MKVNGLGLASEEMNHVKNLLYVSKLRTRKSGLCLSLHIFGVVNGCSSRGRQASAGQTPQPDSLKKVLAFKKFAISFSKPLGPLLSFHSRLPDACLVLDLAGWPWVFISFLTTALFGHLTFYTSPKWETQLKKRDPNHTEGRTMDNLCCPKMASTVCRSLLGELQSLIWYWTHADKWTWSAVFKLESMHQKRWCPSTHQTSGKQLLTVSLLGANTAREAKLLHWKCVPYLSVLKRLTRPQSWPLAAACGQPYHHRGTPGYLQTSVAALTNIQRGGLQGWTGGICRARNRGRKGTATQELKREARPLTWQDMRLFPRQKRDVGMRRWRGKELYLRTVEQKEFVKHLCCLLASATLESCYSFSKHLHFTSHTIKTNTKTLTWCFPDALPYLLCVKANQHPAF